MPTILSHAAVPLALGLGLGSRVIARPLLYVGILGAMLPDLDVLAFRLHIPYADSFGHRGASHSLAFALCIACLALLMAQRWQVGRRSAFLFAGVCTASHGILDMFTNGGLGVALWWPLSSQRIFAPWQPIEVSPIGLGRIFTARGMEVLQSELVWIWIPALAVFTALWILRPREVFSDNTMTNK